ncbi:MAG TPA: SDR family oxidoreductase, partial [Actinomycetota bacterium]|nr:SDR family oxidoreductase [Actinomycetota bacterium]
MRLEGRVAIVSGGGTGIGAATARRFAAEGARVVVTGRRPEPLEAVAAEIGGLAFPGDAADPDHAPAVVTAAVGRFGGLDIVVANAGVGFGGSAGEVDDEHWLRTLDVNLTGPLRLVRAALPALLERGGGSIVLVSSISGLVASTESAAYLASKQGLIGLARSLAVDYGPRGIRANALCPGWVVTPMADEGADELAALRGVSREEAYLIGTELVPLRRPATAEEMAACILFLASDESSYVTGATLVADGGTTIVDA